MTVITTIRGQSTKEPECPRYVSLEVRNSGVYSTHSVKSRESTIRTRDHNRRHPGFRSVKKSGNLHTRPSSLPISYICARRTTVTTVRGPFDQEPGGTLVRNPGVRHEYLDTPGQTTGYLPWTPTYNLGGDLLTTPVFLTVRVYRESETSHVGN